MDHSRLEYLWDICSTNFNFMPECSLINAKIGLNAIKKTKGAMTLVKRHRKTLLPKDGGLFKMIRTKEYGSLAEDLENDCEFLLNLCRTIATKYLRDEDKRRSPPNMLYPFFSADDGPDMLISYGTHPIHRQIRSYVVSSEDLPYRKTRIQRHPSKGYSYDSREQYVYRPVQTKAQQEQAPNKNRNDLVGRAQTQLQVIKKPLMYNVLPRKDFSNAKKAMDKYLKSKRLREVIIHDNYNIFDDEDVKNSKTDNKDRSVIYNRLKNNYKDEKKSQKVVQVPSYFESPSYSSSNVRLMDEPVQNFQKIPVANAENNVINSLNILNKIDKSIHRNKEKVINDAKIVKIYNSILGNDDTKQNDVLNEQPIADQLDDSQSIFIGEPENYQETLFRPNYDTLESLYMPSVRSTQCASQNYGANRKYYMSQSNPNLQYENGMNIEKQNRLSKPDAENHVTASENPVKQKPLYNYRAIKLLRSLIHDKEEEKNALNYYNILKRANTENKLSNVETNKNDNSDEEWDEDDDDPLDDKRKMYYQKKLNDLINKVDQRDNELHHMISFIRQPVITRERMEKFRSSHSPTHSLYRPDSRIFNNI